MICIIVLNCFCLFLCVDIYSDGTEVIEEKTLGALAHIRAGALNCTSSHHVPQYHLLIVKKEKKIHSHFKNVVDETLKIINFINS